MPSRAMLWLSRFSQRLNGKRQQTRSLTKKVRPQRTPCSLLTSCSASSATLKNDDAEDSEEEGDTDQVLAEKKLLQKDSTKKLAAERQPTGRVVGVVKRNWRS